jgi:hypothetical protein
MDLDLERSQPCFFLYADTAALTNHTCFDCVLSYLGTLDENDLGKLLHENWRNGSKLQLVQVLNNTESLPVVMCVSNQTEGLSPELKDRILLAWRRGHTILFAFSGGAQLLNEHYPKLESLRLLSSLLPATLYVDVGDDERDWERARSLLLGGGVVGTILCVPSGGVVECTFDANENVTFRPRLKDALLLRLFPHIGVVEVNLLRDEPSALTDLLNMCLLNHNVGFS